ncbi:YhjD/YihY/BrkB family envelope integrity protein [Halobaculum limi]|uniref:YhjD/YihY/BrkB family envelope integrity protein n=1 Tax=Halobaculum limi TaxID=3031916 RepID=UPI0024068361|nr:YhjD/YihY/BrkB family envelope integrity protein [Halobaculum sp. YSMS11]
MAITDIDWPRGTGVVRAVVDRCRSCGLGFLAAGVAYYALVSLVPLLALVLLAVSTVAGDVVAARVVAAAGDALSVTGRETVQRVLTTAAGRARATGIGIVVLVWGGWRLFRGLDHAFGRVYRCDDDGTVHHLLDAAVALVGVLVAGVAVVAVEVLPAAWWSGPLGGIAGGGLQLLLVVVFLVPAFYLLPNVEMRVREAVPGAAVTAVGWAALYAGFDRYVSVSGGSALSGLLGGIVLVVTWLYLAAATLLVGAAVNAVLAEQ